MPNQWRIFTLTGLSETVFTPPVDVASLPVGPTPTFAVYADDGSITSSGGTVSAWGSLTQSTPGNRPVLVSTDTVDGGVSVALSPGQSLVAPAGLLNFLSQGASTVIFVWRVRKWDPRSLTALLDTSSNGSTAGLQIQIADDSTNNGRYRKIRARMSNGSSFIVDEPPGVGNFNNCFMAGKWTISAVQVSTSRAALLSDGEFSYDLAESFAMPGGTPSPFVVAGGYIDLRCIWIKQGGLSDVDMRTVVSTLATRFSVQPLVQVAGAPLVGNQYLAFPGLTVLPGGNLATCYRTGVAHSGDIGTISVQTSTNRGKTWGAPATIQSDLTEDSRDPCFSKQLANGDFLCNYFLQVIGGADGHETSFFRRSSNNMASWGSPVQVTAGVTMGTHGFEACSAPIVETATAGRLLFPLYGKNDGESFTSAWAVISTNSGSTWPSNVRFANGVTDSRSYSEPSFELIKVAHQGLNIGDILAIVRDDTTGNSMWEFKSTNGGASFTNLGTFAVAHSSGRSLMQLASGEIIWCGRPNDPAAAIMRRTGTAAWTSTQVDTISLGVIDASMSYSGIVETSPGVITAVFSRETQGNPNPSDDVVCRPDLYEGQLFAKLPMVVSPTSAGVSAAGTQQITSRGALPFAYAMQASGSGSPSVSASGLYTAGVSNGTDVVRVTDINGQFIDATFTVTGGVTLPTAIDSGNLTAWWDPTQGIAFQGGPGGAPNVGAWTSADASGRVLTATGVTVPVTGTALNSKASITFDGATGYFTNGVTINTLLGASSWTVGLAFKDTGSIASTGNYFTMAAFLASVTDGVFALGTTATQVYGGQGDTGAGSTFDIRAASASTAHYAVIQYDAGAGKIFISVDGGSFDAGTTVAVLGTSVTTITVGKSGVVGAFEKGSLGNLCIWKSKIAGSNLTSLQTFLASTI